MLCIFVSLSQLSPDRAVEPAKSLPQLPVKKSHCDILMDGLAQRATEAGECRRGDPLQSVRKSEEDPPPARQETAAPDHRAPEPDHAAPIQEGVSGCAASAHPGFSSI